MSDNQADKHPSLIVQGGRVIDPAEGIDAVLDVSVSDGKIARVGADLPSGPTTEVVDASGCLVTPGLIDLHTHVFPYVFAIGIDADEVGVRSAVTTVVDCSAFPTTFSALRGYVVDHARTRVLSYLRFSEYWWSAILEYGLSHGLSDAGLRRLLDPDSVAELARENHDVIKGLKVYAYGPNEGLAGLKALNIGKEAAKVAGISLVSHISNPRSQLLESGQRPLTSEVLELLEAGDVLIHCCTGLEGGLFQQDGTILPEVGPALERGVLFDVAHGAFMFSFEEARKLLDAEILPNTISTDIHIDNRERIVFDLPTTLAKFLALGLDLETVIACATVNPARALGLDDALGSLKPGKVADLSILKSVEGQWDFVDSHGQSLRADKTLVPWGAVSGGDYIQSSPSTFLAQSSGEAGPGESPSAG